jgi:hypothetical protein
MLAGITLSNASASAGNISSRRLIFIASSLVLVEGSLAVALAFVEDAVKQHDAASAKRDAVTLCTSQGLHLALRPEFAQLEFLNLARPCQRKSLDQEPVPRGLCGASEARM